MATSDLQAYWHCLLPEEVRVFSALVHEPASLSDADRSLMASMAMRLVEEREEQAHPDRRAARLLMQCEADDEDDMEVDDNATVIKTETGFWVQTWEWVAKEDADEMTAETDEQEDE
jgi:hypothetical protein